MRVASRRLGEADIYSSDLEALRQADEKQTRLLNLIGTERASAGWRRE